MSADSSDGKQALRDRFKQATARAILSAAEQALVEHGLHGAGMGDIAARAGVAVGTLYNYFKDRESLLAALVAERQRELLARIDEVIVTKKDASFRELLTAFTEAVVEHFAAHRDFLRVILDEQFSVRSALDARRANEPLVAQIHARVEALMRQGLRERALRHETSGLCTAVFLGMLKGTLIHDQLGPGSSTGAATLVSLFLEGAGAQPASAETRRARNLPRKTASGTITVVRHVTSPGTASRPKR